jgi:hypothetical protein
MQKKSVYQRYRIEKRRAPNIVRHPSPFRVKIKKKELLKLILGECFYYRGKKRVIVSNPCAYGVFSGPVGGFAPREHLCVGCLRCTTEYPHISTILPNPEWHRLGDSYMTPYQADTIIYEAESGSLAVKGAGYRGKFGGKGWDGLWTDMSEIVRPTRDGIYGREYISTEVTLGERPPFLTFDSEGKPTQDLPRTITIPLPMLLSWPPKAPLDHPIASILSEAARQLQTYTLLPFELLEKFSLKGPQIIPLISPKQWDVFKTFGASARFLELTEGDEAFLREIESYFPEIIPILRTDFEEDLLPYYRAGFRIFHLSANAQGLSKTGGFILDLIREAHLTFVKKKCRDRVTLICSGGIVAAEHIPKAILLGADVVPLDSPLLVALQIKLDGENAFHLPKQITQKWGVQRIKNLMGAWQDQLFEFAGAMGIREIRRMRGEIGRLLVQKELEREAFSEIQGYAS